MNSMIWENWVPFKKNKREALIKKMVLKRLGDEIRLISYQKFVFSCQNDVLVDQNVRVTQSYGDPIIR